MAQKKFIIDGGFSTNAESTITGNLVMSGNVLPAVDSNGVTGYDLGAANTKWRSLYLSGGSLYVDGQQVISSDAGTILVQSDLDQNLSIVTTGTGTLTFSSPSISVEGNMVLAVGKSITMADSSPITFGGNIDANGNAVINVASPVTGTDAANKTYVDAQIAGILNSAPDALNTLAELAAALGNDADFASNVTNTLALKAATTYVDSQDTATLNAAKVYADGLAFGQGSDLTATNNRVTTLEGEMDAAEGRLTVNEGDIAALETDLAQEVSDRIAADNALTTALQTYADQAEVDAKAYTDTRETAITTAYTTAIATATAAQDEINELADVNITSVASGQILRYDLGSEKWVNATLNTTIIAEGTKLFYQDSRVGAYLTANSYATQAYVNGLVQSKDSLSELSGTTDDLTEGETNLFFSADLARAAVAQDIADAVAQKDELGELADINITSVANGQFLRYDLGSTKWVNVTPNTTMIAEGTKLYFNDARAQAAVAGDISSAVAAEATARANADAALQTQIDFITSNVDAEALDSLTEIVAAFQTADGNLVTTVTSNTTAINNEVTARTNADAALQTELNTTQTGAGLGASGAYTAIGAYNSETNATGGHYIGGATSLANADKLLDSALKAEATARSGADTTLQANIDNLSDQITLIDANLTTAVSDIADETTARENSDNTLQANIDAEATARENSDNTLQANIDAEANARIAADSTEATTRENADAALADDLTAKIGDGTVNGTEGNTLTDRIATALSSANSYTDDRESAITTAYQAADTGLQTQINTEKGRIDAILTASTADKDTFAEIVTFINSVDTTNDTALGTEITTRANADAALQTELDATQAGAGLGASGAYTAIGVYDADTNTTGGHYIGGATSLVNADKLLDSALKAVDTGYKAASADFDSRLDIIEGNATTAGSIQRALADANAYADQAEADAIAAAEAKDVTRAAAANAYADQVEVDAKAYTDTRETAITTAYQTYADQAEVDAKAYTDTRETAITTAYQTYADQAEVDAIAAAEAKDVVRAAAANAYADSAEADAKAYTDTRETAITTAYQTYADSAEADAITSANSYTDTREGAITTAYQTYADSAEADAIAAAEAKDVVRAAAANAYADQAEADAKSYADGIVGTEATARANADAALQTELNTTQAGAGLGASGAYTAIGVYDADTNATGGYYIGGATSLANADKLLDSALKAEELVRSAGDSATLSSAQSYADSAEADAIAAAEAKDVVRAAAANAYADQAEADAKAYTDTRESAITTAYQAADTVLQNNINTEKGRIDAILTASTADKDTFAEIVTFINAVDSTNDTALGTEITTRANADATLQTNINNEATARANADTALADDLTAKIGDGTVDGSEGNTITDRIATSLSSAQSYADQVEVDAKAYTDTRESAITTAYQNYADQAEVDAKAYTDTRESAITTAYEAADTVLQTAIDTKLAASSYTAADVLTKIKTVDGAGSGLDADLLDGQSGAYYLNWTNVTNKPDPVITVTLTGDVTGTANTTLTDLASGTVSVSTTIAANSVALGTDTTGNYMVNVAAGTDISVSHTQGEGSTATVSNTSTLDSVTGRGASTTNGITVGSVTVDSVNTMDGTTSTVASTTQTAVDLYLAANYAGAKLFISARDTVSGNTQMSELLITNTSTVASATEYGVVQTSGLIAAFDVDVSSGMVRLLVTGASTNSTKYQISMNAMMV